MKITFGMIVFEGDYVLKECLKQVYPFAHQILIAEGPVSYWQNKGKITSEDETNSIIDDFPDPENKIKIVHGRFKEKDEQCNAYMQYLKPDTDYLWNLDSDEVYKTQDLNNILNYLNDKKPTSVGVRSCTFYGGFDHYLTGFELNKDNFKRIFKVTPGSTWLKHRPPTIKYPTDIKKNHIDSNTLYRDINFQMYHYSYVFPDQVYKKINYYKEAVSKDNCIDDYFKEIYLPWVLNKNDDRTKVENKYRGVHEYKPNYRGDCKTTKFNDRHPESIEENLGILKDKFNNQLNKYKQL